MVMNGDEPLDHMFSGAPVIPLCTLSVAEWSARCMRSRGVDPNVRRHPICFSAGP